MIINFKSCTRILITYSYGWDSIIKRSTQINNELAPLNSCASHIHPVPSLLLHLTCFWVDLDNSQWQQFKFNNTKSSNNSHNSDSFNSSSDNAMGRREGERLKVTIICGMFKIEIVAVVVYFNAKIVNLILSSLDRDSA